MVASATVVMMAEEEIDVLVEIERGNGSLTLVFCVRVSCWAIPATPEMTADV